MAEEKSHDKVMARLRAAHAHAEAQHKAAQAAVDEHLASRVRPDSTPTESEGTK